MTNINDLQSLIDQQAHTAFDSKFDNDWDLENDDARLAFQALKNTDEFKKFRDAMIKQYKGKITDDFLHKIENIKEIIKQAGDE